jgi:hypothetical protein
VLKQNGQGNTLIVAKDGGADICNDMAADPEYVANPPTTELYVANPPTTELPPHLLTRLCCLCALAR